MADDQYRLKEKTDIELHEWLIEQQPDSPEYEAGIRESMRRVAGMELELEKMEDSVRKRELLAFGLAIVAIAVAITVVVMWY